MISLISTRALPIGTFLLWLIPFILILLCIYKYSKTKFTHEEKLNIPINLYATYIIISICIGFFLPSGYWQWKSFISNIIVLSYFVFFYHFQSINNIYLFWTKWVKYILFCFFPLMLIMTPDSYGIYLAPILVFLIAIKYLKKSWKIIILLLTAIAISDFGARSIFAKYVIAFLLGFSFWIGFRIPQRLMKFGSILLFIIPIIFLILGVTGLYNIFQYGNESKKELILHINNATSEDLLADTRTFAYEAVITTSVKNNTILFGMTPAKNAKTKQFQNTILKITGRKNECGITNLYMWCGIIGVVLLMAIYIKAVYLSICRSNNYISKLLGIYIAFRWMWFWIEDIQDYYIDNIVLYAMIAMCFSKQFRKLRDIQIALFIRSLFNNNVNKYFRLITTIKRK